MAPTIAPQATLATQARIHGRDQNWAIACCARARMMRPAHPAFFSATGGSPPLSIFRLCYLRGLQASLSP